MKIYYLKELVVLDLIPVNYTFQRKGLYIVSITNVPNVSIISSAQFRTYNYVHRNQCKYAPTIEGAQIEDIN